LREGFFNYIRALTSVLHAHHLTEDELAFPYFRQLLPQAHFDILIDWHKELAQILDEIKLTAEKVEKNDHPEIEIKNLENALIRLRESWLPHIQMETDAFIRKADSLISVDERLRLVRSFAEHGQKHSVPPFLTVPFLIYNLSEPDRKIFTQDMPPEVLEHLVPIVWKVQWESMKPFFLM
jgi:hypothetical protein